ncbi:MAG: hypothetical protein LBL90_01145 [Prevotellaceae bacterium]|jgi:hypothetical protein|nr:hypothetical protein [Prevotellaceae bacterium]
MIFDSIKRNFIAIITSCIAILLVLWGLSLLLQGKTEILAHDNNMPLFQLVIGLFYGEFWLTVGAGASIIIITGILLYRINEVHLFITDREPLLAILFVSLASAFSTTHYLLSIHPALLLTILSINRLFYTYRRDYAFREVFMGALYISIATLFYAPAIWFLLVFIICLSLMKPISLRDWLVIIAGIITPYIFALFYYYFAQGNWQIPFILLAENLYIKHPSSFPEFSIAEWIYLVYSISISLFAILRSLFLPALGTKIKTIRINNVFIWLFFISLFCCVFYPAEQSKENLISITLPMSVLISNFFSSIKTNFGANTFFVLLMLSIISIQLPNDFYTYILDIFESAKGFICGLF